MGTPATRDRFGRWPRGAGCGRWSSRTGIHFSPALHPSGQETGFDQITGLFQRGPGFGTPIQVLRRRGGWRQDAGDCNLDKPRSVEPRRGHRCSDLTYIQTRRGRTTAWRTCSDWGGDWCPKNHLRPALSEFVPVDAADLAKKSRERRWMEDELHSAAIAARSDPDRPSDIVGLFQGDFEDDGGVGGGLGGGRRHAEGVGAEGPDEGLGRAELFDFGDGAVEQAGGFAQ